MFCNHTVFDGVRKPVAAMLFLAGIISSPLRAQSLEFADDFTKDSLRYSVIIGSQSSGIVSQDAETDGLRITTSADDDSEGAWYMDTWGETNALAVTMTLNGETTLPSSEDSSSVTSASVELAGTFYNDTAENGSGSRVGDILANLSIRKFDTGFAVASYCLSRYTSEEGDHEPLSEFGGDFCGVFESGLTLVEFDHQNTLAIRLDPVANSMVFSINDVQHTVNLSTSVYAPYRSRKGIAIKQKGVPGLTDVTLHRVSTDAYDDDFSASQPVVGRYYPITDVETKGRDITVEEGQAKLVSVAANDDSKSLSIEARNGIDFIGAQLMLSSESTVSNTRNSRVIAEVGGRFYNDTANGGTDGRLGDVQASVGIQIRGDGTSEAYYCLQRYDIADGSSRVSLLEDGRLCNQFSLHVDYDTPYRVSINLDREAKTLTLKLNARAIVHTIETDIFDPNDEYHKVWTNAQDAATSIVYVDNLRTAADALTAAEIESGALPEVPEGSDAGVEGEVVYDQPLDVVTPVTELSFFDDFSDPSAHNLTLFTDPDVGVTQVNATQGAFEIRTASGEDEATDVHLYNWDSTDRMMVRVSLSSLTDIPAYAGSEGRVRIGGYFYNDTVDGGYGDRGGDVWADIAFTVKNTGRRELKYCLRRKTESGASEDLNIIDNGDNCGYFDDFVPDYDTPYNLLIQLDREQQVLVFGVDDRRKEVALPTAAYVATQKQKNIAVRHQAPSGQTVAKIYSVQTDNYTTDFTADTIAMGPYAPYWDVLSANSTMSFVDGMAKLEATSKVDGDEGTQLRLVGNTDYLSAKLKLSSGSTIAENGRIRVRIGGIFYNDTGDATGASGEDYTGDVFIGLGVKQIDGGAAFFEYCAYRSNNADFSDTFPLITNANGIGCDRFATAAQLDGLYPVSIALDREANTITFTVADERIVFQISTGVYSALNELKRVDVHANEGSTVVGFVDDLRTSVSAPSLVLSDNVVGAQEFPKTDSPEQESDDGSNSNSSGGGSGGGGCSVAANSTVPLLPLMLLVSIVILTRRRSVLKVRH